MHVGQPAQLQVPSLDVEVDIPLNLSNFWRSFDLLLMDCEVELDVSWAKDCVLIEHDNKVTGLNFMITSAKH